MNTYAMEHLTPVKDLDSFDLYESDVIEMPLLLSGMQMSALEQVAHQRGQTTAGMVRQLLREFVAGQSVRSA